MKKPFDTEWVSNSRNTFDRLPANVQAGFLNKLPQIVSTLAEQYRSKRDESVSVGMISYVNVPDWSMWFRLETAYVEDSLGPILFINELEELTKAEVDASIVKAERAKQQP